MTRDELITALEKAEAVKEDSCCDWGRVSSIDGWRIHASRFRGFSTDKCRAAMRALYDEVFVFSISAFPDKPFVTFDIRAICWNLKSEARSGRRRSIHHEGMPHRIFRWIRKRLSSFRIKVRLLQNIYLRCRAHETSQALPAFEGDRHNQCMNKNAQVSICRRLGSLCGGRMIRAWRAIWTFGGLPASIWPCVVCQREWMWIPWDCLEYFVTRMFSCHQYVYHGR
jgi:hypothetical protein